MRLSGLIDSWMRKNFVKFWDRCESPSLYQIQTDRDHQMVMLSVALCSVKLFCCGLLFGEIKRRVLY